MNTTIQIVQHLSMGGIETMALDFASHSANNERHFIISLEGKKQELLKQWPRLKAYSDQIICIEKPQGVHLASIGRLVDLFKHLQADCIHTHHIGPLIYGGIACRLAGVKSLIHTEHDAWHLDNSKRRMVQNLILKLTQPIFVADAHKVAKKVHNYFSNINPKVIHNGIDTQRFCMGNKQLARSILHLPQNVRLLGCAGRFAFEKGQSVLIEALARLPKRVHLALAGSGEMEKELKQACLRFNVENRVHFLGQVNDMARFYQSLDIFCLPSYKEGFPLSPLEAQACGIPVVATKTGASCEAVSPEIGEIVEPGDSLAMANGIRRVNKLITRHDYEPSTPRNFVTSFAKVTQMVAAYSSLKHQ